MLLYLDRSLDSFLVFISNCYCLCVIFSLAIFRFTLARPKVLALLET